MEKAKDTLETMSTTSALNDFADADIPTECIDKVTDAIKAMQKAYIARSICAANHKKNTMEKRRAAAKNAKKMRKMQRRHKK